MRITLLAALFFFASNAPAALRITIDPGHGGPDAGATQKGLREADLVLEVSRRLKALLDRDPRFKAHLTRDDDVRISLQERVRLAELHESDIFLSLHANSSRDPRARGMEVYLQSPLPADEDILLLAAIENQKESLGEQENGDREALSKKNDVALIVEDLRRNSRVRSSLRLSRTLSRLWVRPEQRSSRPIRQAPFFVINRAPGASALIELGFLTHPSDRQWLKTPDLQQRMAEAIYQGLLDYRRQIAAGHSSGYLLPSGYAN